MKQSASGTSSGNSTGPSSAPLSTVVLGNPPLSATTTASDSCENDCLSLPHRYPPLCSAPSTKTSQERRRRLENIVHSALALLDEDAEDGFDGLFANATEDPLRQ